MDSVLKEKDWAIALFSQDWRCNMERNMLINPNVLMSWSPAITQVQVQANYSIQEIIPTGLTHV